MTESMTEEKVNNMNEEEFKAFLKLISKDLLDYREKMHSDFAEILELNDYIKGFLDGNYVGQCIIMNFNDKPQDVQFRMMFACLNLFEGRNRGKI